MGENSLQPAGVSQVMQPSSHDALLASFILVPWRVWEPSAAKREVRVVARGWPVNHATSRSTLMAVAIATCCKWVLSRPRYRVRRRPKARTPCERVPSIPRPAFVEIAPGVGTEPRAGRL